MSSSTLHAGLTYWDYAVVVVYAIWMLGIGLYYSRRQTNLNEYFLGERRMNAIIVGISTMATLVSTITYLTTPGEIIKYGFGVLWATLSIVFAFFVVGYMIIPKIMASQIVSGYQLLESQFGTGIRRAAAGLFIFTRVAWVGMVVYTCSVALAAMTGWPLQWILIGVGGITTVYTVIGGIRGVIITDVTQAFILFAGAVAVVIFAMWHAHSFTGWWPSLGNPEVKAALNWPKIPVFAANMTTRITVFGMILHQVMWWIAVCSSDQLAIQRYLSTKDAPAARKSFLVNGIANVIVASFLVLAGIGLLGYFLLSPGEIPALKTLVPHLKPAELAAINAKMASMTDLQKNIFVLTQGADKVFPWFIAHILPAGISGLLLAALFAAAMSSVSSGINSITTVMMVDFPHIFARKVSEAAGIGRAKLIGVWIGIITTGVSFLLQFIRGNFMEVAQKINLFFVAPLGALFFMAFFIKRTNKQGAWAAILVGFVVGVVMSYYGEIYQLLTGKPLHSTFTYTLAFAFTASITAGYLVSLLFPAPGKCADVETPAGDVEKKPDIKA